MKNLSAPDLLSRILSHHNIIRQLPNRNIKESQTTQKMLMSFKDFGVMEVAKERQVSRQKGLADAG